MFPEEVRGFTHTCPSFPSSSCPSTRTTKYKEDSHGCSLEPSKLTCHNLAVLLGALWPAGVGGVGGSSPPDEMLLPAERGLGCIHRLDQQLLWSKLDVANLAMKQNKKPHQFGTQALSIQPGVKPRSFHCSYLQCEEMMWLWLCSACEIQTKELHLLLLFIFCITEHYLETVHCTCTKERWGFLSTLLLSLPTLPPDTAPQICVFYEMLSSHEDK